MLGGGELPDVEDEGGEEDDDDDDWSSSAIERIANRVSLLFSLSLCPRADSFLKRAHATPTHSEFRNSVQLMV